MKKLSSSSWPLHGDDHITPPTHLRIKPNTYINHQTCLLYQYLFPLCICWDIWRWWWWKTCHFCLWYLCLFLFLKTILLYNMFSTLSLSYPLIFLDKIIYIMVLLLSFDFNEFFCYSEFEIGKAALNCFWVPLNLSVIQITFRST